MTATQINQQVTANHLQVWLKKGWLKTLCVLLCAGVCSPAVTADTDGLMLEEVVVTAQKREQSQQDVPVAITSHSALALEKARITDLVDLSDVTPGLSAESIGLRSPFIFMRGTGSGSFDIGSDPSVSVFIDELYIPRFSAMQFGLADVERVEVLKGPQGTLFGRNTSGGAISVVSQKPTEDLSGNVSFNIGNKNYYALSSSVNGALSDNVLGRISLTTTARDGWVENTVTGVDHSDAESFGGKGSLLFVGENYEALFSLSYTKDNANATTYQNVTDSILFLSPFAPPPALSDDPEKQAYNTDGFQDREATVTSLKVDWDLGFATATSVTGYISSEFTELHDLDGTTADTFDRAADEQSDSFSQEFRLASNEEGTLSWLGGIYYFYDEAERRDNFILGTDSSLSAFFNGGASFFTTDEVEIDTTSWAVFGHIDYDLSEKWQLSLGIRYSEDEKDSHRSASATAPSPLLPVAYIVKATPKWESFTPKIALQYFAADDIMLYASYSEGFKSGGIQSSIQATPLQAATVFNPEEVESWELGFKSVLLDNRLRLNVALFHVEYSDLQFIAGTGALVVTTNAAESTTDGIELDFEAAISERLRISGGYAWLDAKFDRYIDGAGIDQSGNQIVRTPKHQGNIAVVYEMPLDSGSLTYTVNARAQSRTFFEPSNNDTFSQPGYEQFGARIEYAHNDGDWRVALWGRNLNNEEVCANIIALPGNVGLCSIDALRSYGASINYEF